MGNRNELLGNKGNLDRNRVAGMTSNIPTGAHAVLREHRVAARNVFFGMDHVEFVGGLAALVGNGQETNAVERTGSRAEFREMQAKFVPGKIRQIDKQQQAERREDESTHTEARFRRGYGCAGHETIEIVPEQGTQLNQVRGKRVSGKAHRTRHMAQNVTS